MIPLHLTETTVHVDPAQAERLVAAAVAEWLPGVRALRARVWSDREVLAALA
jgi:hypothetical protein